MGAGVERSGLGQAAYRVPGGGVGYRDRAGHPGRNWAVVVDDASAVWRVGACISCIALEAQQKALLWWMSTMRRLLLLLRTSDWAKRRDIPALLKTSLSRTSRC